MKNITILLALLFCTVLCHAEDDLDSQYATDMLAVGTKAPAITIGEGASAHNLIDDIKGKYTILEFWASWCGDCRRDMKAMRELNALISENCDVAIVGYSFDRTKEAWEKCVNDSALTWEQHLTPVPMRNSPVAKDYCVKWIPSYYIIDKEGNIVLGTVMSEKLMAYIRKLLNKE